VGALEAAQLAHEVLSSARRPIRQEGAREQLHLQRQQVAKMPTA